jgi:hypothetical protein
LPGIELGGKGEAAARMVLLESKTWPMPKVGNRDGF